MCFLFTTHVSHLSLLDFIWLFLVFNPTTRDCWFFQFLPPPIFAASILQASYKLCLRVYFYVSIFFSNTCPTTRDNATCLFCAGRLFDFPTACRLAAPFCKQVMTFDLLSTHKFCRFNPHTQTKSLSFVGLHHWFFQITLPRYRLNPFQ